MIGQFEHGQQVRVFPHGSPNESALGIVALISENQRAIAVGFEEMPPFVLTHESRGFAVHPVYGITLLAHRFEVGPWIEAFNGGHYEIEKIEVN